MSQQNNGGGDKEECWEEQNNSEVDRGGHEKDAGASEVSDKVLV